MRFVNRRGVFRIGVVDRFRGERFGVMEVHGGTAYATLTAIITELVERGRMDSECQVDNGAVEF
jgi:hypothetical protein